MQASRDDRIALALGAGGARGLAQIGVIEAIQARGLHIASVAGSSSGALVGGVFAAGKLAEFREGIEALDRGAFLRLLSDPALGEGGLFHGHRLVAAMRAVVGDP
ncbi:MAG TPA: patatin-like phospholipase family protein, partial [Lysobacter sp.]|nr:patatin-like phospholipase family protein [Lysobacter sp.]